MKRRVFNGYLGSFLLGAGLAPALTMAGVSDTQTETHNLYASASVDDEGQHWLIAFNQQGEEQLRHSLPSRAHQVLKHPTKPWLLVVARRPGEYLQIIDLQSKQLIKQLDASEGQHFSGHMQISKDGRLLYTTENITRTSEGVVVVRELYGDYQVSSQFSSGGIGPHQLILDDSEKVMVVANGGIHTQDRVKLNLDSMQANLTYINLNSEKIVERVTLSKEQHQLSIRHIDINRLGDVVVAMQYQGERTDQVPLVATHRPGTEFKFLDIPQAEYYQLKHYCGSVCFDSQGSTVAISAPKGDRVLFWDVQSASYLGSVKVRDGCGVAKSSVKGQFVVSSGRGKVYHIDATTLTKTAFLKNEALQWDNHLAAIS